MCVFEVMSAVLNQCFLSEARFGIDSDFSFVAQPYGSAAFADAYWVQNKVEKRGKLVEKTEVTCDILVVCSVHLRLY